MRILWMSNAPWCQTGYGTQTAQILPRLRDAGHDVAVFANYGLNGAVMDWQGFPVFPSGYEPYGNDVLPLWAKHWFGGEPGLVITLYDTWTLDPRLSEQIKHIACWAPVDHSPPPPKVLSWFEQSGAWPIAYSKFGQASLEANGIQNVMYAPHALDMDLWRPVDKYEARRHLGIPEDRFVVGMVAANIGTNPPRKGWDAQFRAFRAFSEGHPDAVLYLHTEMHGRYGKGVDLPAMLTHYDITPDKVAFCDQLAYRLGAIPTEEMVMMYSALDVLSAASLGEGFGLPLLEAQACGCPVITTDFAAGSELAGPGWAVRGQPYYDASQASDYMIPNDYAILTALQAAYARRDAGALRESCRGFASGYDADLVFKRDWLPILEMLEATVVA